VKYPQVEYKLGTMEQNVSACKLCSLTPSAWYSVSHLGYILFKNLAHKFK